MNIGPFFDQLLYFAITIGILVFVHELGHFLAAKSCKMQTDVFALGFGKRLFGWNRINGFTFGKLDESLDLQGHTDYRICLLPLGGYVKIAGMIDESFDTEFANKEPQPYEFRSKSAWQKAFVISAGVLMNFFLALAVFAVINYSNGKRIYHTTEIGYVQENSVANQAGLKSLDNIKKINGKAVRNYEDVINNLLINNAGSDIQIDLIRNGKDTSFTISKSVINDFQKKEELLPVGETGMLITAVGKNTPAERAGFIAADTVVSINSENIFSSAQFSGLIKKAEKKEITVIVKRGDDMFSLYVTPDDNNMIGVGIQDYYAGKYDILEYGALASVQKGFTDIFHYSALTGTMLKKVITGEVEFKQSFGGPVKIAKYAASSADKGFMAFIFFLGMLSLSLALINILPFPVLDGGHLVIIIIEGLAGKEIPVKIKLAVQQVGFFILMALMVFIIYNDFL